MTQVTGRPIGILLAALLLPAFGAAVRPVAAGEETVTIPSATGLVLDGRPDETAWESAASLPVEAVEVPAWDEDGSPGTRRIQPRVRALVADGALWIAVETDEAPGTGIGLVLLAAPRGVASAADAVAVGYTPQDVRSPPWVVEGPRGGGRLVTRVRGAAHVKDVERWSLEVALPLADLGFPSPATPLVLALAVKTRTPGRIAWAPPASAFRGPDAWFVLVPEGSDGWPAGPGEPADTGTIPEEEERDRQHLEAWARFLRSHALALHDLLEASGVEGGVAEGLTDDQVLQVLRCHLVEPLEEIARLRPDLAFVHVVRGHVLHQIGRDDEARAAFDAALAIAPGLREAAHGRWLEIEGPALVGGDEGAVTDYVAALDAARRAEEAATDPFARDGAVFGRGLLLTARGDFEEAVHLLAPLALRYPFQQAVVYGADRARRGLATWPREVRYREMEASRDDLPRVRWRTTKGDVVFELFEDDAPNTVKNFVWLTRHGFYEGTAFATVPFFAVRGGDARTRPGAEGRGHGPGYAIPAEIPEDHRPYRSGSRSDARRRRPFRGALAMASAERDGAGSAFVLFTGSAMHLEDEIVAFGRVLEGQDVVDALVADDRILEARVERTRPGVEYRPLTVEGLPASPPR